MNIAEHVERGRRLFPDRVAVQAGDARWTYADLDAYTGRLAAHLRSTGVASGDRVALLLPNTAVFVVAYLAVLKLGATVVPVNTRLQAVEIGHILDDSRCAPVLTTPDLRPKLPRTAAVRVLPARGAPADFDFTPDGGVPTAQLDRDTPSTLLYTSGTTGQPKGALLSHGNVVSNMNAKVRHTGMGPDDRLMLFLPLYHCYGLNAVLNAGLNACASVVVLPSFDRGRCLRTIRDERITMFFAVPSVYRLLLDSAVSPDELAGIRYFMSAGAPLPVTTQSAWAERFGTVINEAYGLTETSPFACYNHQFRHRIGSIGAPIENVEVRVVDPATGHPLPVGEIGEIVVRGPNVMLGYWNAPQATAAAIVDGWFRTGDLGRVDEDGYFYLVDRRTDLLIVDGQNVYPAELERVLRAHPGVADVVVYGRPHEVVGHIVCAGVVPARDAPPTRADLRAHCATRLAPYKVPKIFTLLDEIPRGETGKPLRNLLAGTTADGRPGPRPVPPGHDGDDPRLEYVR
ncbi:class I adenylate-forming enzyme family protein [Polymorphospora lycopeni]|uniref:AMP-binding protein n=1 Tax=Polymorphospora lycopeni TaxID=3140240 RepID=A0ABV5CTA3_9ACTN